MLFVEEFQSVIKKYIEPNSTKVTRIDLSRFQLDEDAANELYKSLQQNHHITDIIYDNTNLSPTIINLIDSHLDKIKKQKEILQNRWSSKNESHLTNIQKAYRTHRLYRAMERTTGIHPEKQSVINITKLTAELYADKEQLLTSAENITRGSEALTPEEVALTQEIFKLKLSLKHATTQYEEIKNTSNSLLSLNARARHKLPIGNSATNTGFFRHENIFFSFGSAQHGAAKFITENNKPYTVIELELTPEKFTRHLWFGPHNNYESEAKKFGDTKRIITETFSGEKCIVNYHYPNGKNLERILSTKSYIVTGNYLRQFIGLKLVQELRYIGEPYRGYILKNLKNHALLEAVIDNLFNYPLYDAKIPSELHLKNTKIKNVTPPPADKNLEKNAVRFHDAIKNFDLDSLKLLVANGSDVNILGIDNTTPLIRCLLLLIDERSHSGRNKLEQIAHYLIDQGADASLITAGSNALYCAVRANSIAVARKILSTSGPLNNITLTANATTFIINSKNSIFSVITIAVRTGNLEMLKLLLANGATLNEKNSLQALIEAIDINNIELVRFILQFNPPINQTIFRSSALTKAAENNYVEIMALLIKHGADLNKRCWTNSPDSSFANQTPLMRAVNNGYVEAATLLLEKGALVNEEDEFGKTALDFAKNEKLQNLLKVHDAKPHSKPILKYKFKIAAGIALITGKNKHGIPCFLIGRKKDSQGRGRGAYLLPGGLKDEEDESLQMTAAREAFEETAIPLLRLLAKGKVKASPLYCYDQLNTDINLSTDIQKKSATRYTNEVHLFDVGSIDNVYPKANDDFTDLKWVTKETLFNLDILPSNRELIIAATLDQENLSEEEKSKITECMCKEYNGGNLLINAVIAGDINEVIRLLDSGIAPDASSNVGVSALTMASHLSNLPMTELLLSRGADANHSHFSVLVIECNNYCSPMQAAFGKNNFEIVKLLMSKGGDLNQGYGTRRRSSAFIAAENGNVQFVEYAFKHGYKLKDANNNDNFSDLVEALIRNNISKKCVIAILQLFLDLGFHIDEKDEFPGYTALHWACLSPNHEYLVEFLLVKGADKSIYSNDSHTALDFAYRYRIGPIIQLLHASYEKLSNKFSPST